MVGRGGCMGPGHDMGWMTLMGSECHELRNYFFSGCLLSTNVYLSAILTSSEADSSQRHELYMMGGQTC